MLIESMVVQGTTYSETFKAMSEMFVSNGNKVTTIRGNPDDSLQAFDTAMAAKVRDRSSYLYNTLCYFFVARTGVRCASAASRPQLFSPGPKDVEINDVYGPEFWSVLIGGLMNALGQDDMLYKFLQLFYGYWTGTEG